MEQLTFPVVIVGQSTCKHKTTNEVLTQIHLQQDAYRQNAENGRVYLGVNQTRMIAPAAWSQSKIDRLVKSNAQLPGVTINRIKCAPYEFEVDGVKKELDFTYQLELINQD